MSQQQYQAEVMDELEMQEYNTNFGIGDSSVNLHTRRSRLCRARTWFTLQTFKVRVSKLVGYCLLKLRSDLFSVWLRFVVISRDDVKQEVKTFESKDEVVHKSVRNKPVSEQLCEKLVRTLGKFYGYVETELALTTPQVD